MDFGTSQWRDNILIFNTDDAALDRSKSSIAHQLPSSIITPVRSANDYQKLIQEKDFDVVILDQPLSKEAPDQLISELALMVRQLKNKEFEPSVLILTDAADPRSLNELYGTGCHKCIIKEGKWYDQVGPAVRELLIIRRLEEDNRQLAAKLHDAIILLQEKNRRLDDFSLTVAHDIRGPLGGVSMKLEYILDTYGNEIDRRFAQLLTRALESTERLTHIVQAMYDYAKLGSKAAKMSKVDLVVLVEEVVADMSFDQSHEIKIGIGDLPRVWCNPDLIRRVFINLIQNAVKYNDKHEVIINIGFQKTIEKNIGNFCEIFVQDNGPGISEQEQRDIFMMFSRGASASAEQEGAGIGLAVVRRIMELHYGSVQVESEVGNGAKFILTLPLEETVLSSKLN